MEKISIFIRVLGFFLIATGSEPRLNNTVLLLVGGFLIAQGFLMIGGK